MKGKKRKSGKIVVITVVLILAAGAGLLAVTRNRETKKITGYDFTTITRGNIESTVSSSGTLEAVGTVKVLAQMNGTVEKIYADYNDTVKKDQPLIDLNTELLKIQEKEAEASVLKAKATYELKKLDYSNNQKLFSKKLLSDYDLQTTKTNLDVAAADLESAQAQLEKIRIELNQYALIVSPITGIVLDRNVEVGDTVVSGTSSTSLFTLAENLSKMEIHADVDELDISQIRDGQKVRFTVDAYPEETFPGVVREIRLVPITSNNVVTYTVIVDADNPEGKLLPGMTASLEFLIDEKDNVLLVPNAAFRFQPSGEQAAAAEKKIFEARIAQLPQDQRKQAEARFEEMRKARSTGTRKSSGNILSGSMRFGPPHGSRNSERNGTSLAGGNGNAEKRTLWYLDEKGEMSVLVVDTGATDGTNTEIIGNPGLEGKRIILKVKVE